MPQISSVHTDRPLLNQSIAKVPSGSFVGLQVMKPLIVKNKSDSYWTYSDEMMFGNTPAAGQNKYQRAPRSPYPQISYTVDDDSTYVCHEYGLGDTIDQGEQENADSPMDPINDSAAAIRKNLMIAQEERIAAILFDYTTSFASYTSAVSTAWDNDAGDPLTDRNVAVNSIRLNGAYNRATHDIICIIGVQVLDALLKNPAVVDRIKYTQVSKKDDIDEVALAAYMKVDRVLIGDASYNNADLGQTFNPAYIWGKHAGFYAVSKGNPGLKTPNLGFTALWTKGNGGEPATGMAARRYFDDDLNSHKMRLNHWTDEKLQMAMAGYIIQSVVS